MDILPYLATLLKAHKEVGIDGFGTFFKIRVPGRYDEQTNSYLPPQYTLGFKKEPASTHILTAFVSEERHVSANTANYYINEFAGKLNNELAVNGELTLPGLGKVIQREFDLAVETDPTLDLGHDFFGLPSVKALPAGNPAINTVPEPAEEQEATEPADVEPEINEVTEVENEPISIEPAAHNEEEEVEPEQETEPEIITTETEDVTVPNTVAYTQDAYVAPTEEPFVETEETSIEEENEVATTYVAENDNQHETLLEEDEEAPKKNNAIKWLIVIFVIVAIAAVALMLRPDIYDRMFGNKIADTTTAFDKNKLKSTQDTLTTDTALTNKVKAIFIDSLDSTKTTVKTDTNTYEIFLAGVASEKTAKTLIASYKKMGIKAKGLVGTKYYKISAGTFTSLKVAKDSLKVVKKILKSDDPYINPTPKNNKILYD